MVVAYRLKLVGMVALVACLPASAEDGWKVKPLGVPGWELREKGDWFGNPKGSIVQAVWSQGKARFSIGCSYGHYVDIAWQPSRPFTAGAMVPVTFSVDGKVVATRSFLRRESNDYGWAEPSGDAVSLVQAMNKKWNGTLVISGGGVSDTIVFDEEKIGGVTEVVLTACDK
jgi:hypothetical protein